MFIYILALLVLLPFFFSFRKRSNTIGIFHPNCGSLGGGELVLWTIVKVLLAKTESWNTLIYIYYDAYYKSPDDILKGVESSFNLFLAKKSMYRQIYHTEMQLCEITPRLIFVPLKTAWLINYKYKCCTYLLSSIAVCVSTLEALVRFTPNILLDTVGCAFCAIMAKVLANCTVLGYIHYPMIKKVRPLPNCQNIIHKIWYFRVYMRNCYHRAFAVAYRFTCQFYDCCITNSYWSYHHLVEVLCSPQDDLKSPSKGTEETKQKAQTIYQLLLRLYSTPIFYLPKERLHVIYPPVSLGKFRDIKKPWDVRSNTIISVSQFRPEKNHLLQLEIMHYILKKFPSSSSAPSDLVVPKDLHLNMFGSLRNASDRNFAENLKKRASELGIADRVSFFYDVDRTELIKAFVSSKVALHTMTEEHFGIALVEFLAAGLLVVAHNSGGPAVDILNQYNPDRPVVAEGQQNQSFIVGDYGFLATTKEEFSHAILRCFTPKYEKENAAILTKATASLLRFLENESFGIHCYETYNIPRYIFK